MPNHRLSGIISFFLILILCIQPPTSGNSSQLDITKVGVEAGDVFEYTILSLVFEIPEDTGEEADFEIPIKTGDQVKLGVLNATPTPLPDGNYSIDLLLDLGNKTYGHRSWMKPESLVVFTDWDYWEIYAQSLKPSLFMNIIFTIETPVYNVTNSAEVFIISANFVEDVSLFKGWGDPIYTHYVYEFHYDKTTGVILYGSMFEETVHTSGSGAYSYMELVVSQNGYTGYELPNKMWSDKTSTSNTPFQFIAGISSLIVLYTIRQKKKRY